MDKWKSNIDFYFPQYTRFSDEFDDLRGSVKHDPGIREATEVVMEMVKGQKLGDRHGPYHKALHYMHLLVRNEILK